MNIGQVVHVVQLGSYGATVFTKMIPAEVVMVEGSVFGVKSLVGSFLGGGTYCVLHLDDKGHTWEE